ALDYCRAEGRHADALWVVAALGWCWYTRGDMAHGPTVLDAVLSWAVTGDLPSDAALVAATLIAGIIALAGRQLEQAEMQLHDAFRLATRADDARHAAVAQAFLGHAARARGNYAAAKAHHDNAADGFARLGSPQGVAWARFDLGLLARDRGEP